MSVKTELKRKKGFFDVKCKSKAQAYAICYAYARKHRDEVFDFKDCVKMKANRFRVYYIQTF